MFNSMQPTEYLVCRATQKYFGSMNDNGWKFLKGHFMFFMHLLNKLNLKETIRWAKIYVILVFFYSRDLAIMALYSNLRTILTTLYLNLRYIESHGYRFLQ